MHILHLLSAPFFCTNNPLFINALNKSNHPIRIPSQGLCLMKVAKKGGLAQSPCSQGVEVIIVITNMVLCPGGLSDEVDLWNCIQKPSIRPILPGVA